MAYTPEEEKQNREVIRMFSLMTPEERQIFLQIGFGITFNKTLSKEAN